MPWSRRGAVSLGCDLTTPDGKRLVASETADYTPLDVNAFNPETTVRFKVGGCGVALRGGRQARCRRGGRSGGQRRRAGGGGGRRRAPASGPARSRPRRRAVAARCWCASPRRPLARPAILHVARAPLRRGRRQGRRRHGGGGGGGPGHGRRGVGPAAQGGSGGGGQKPADSCPRLTPEAGAEGHGKSRGPGPPAADRKIATITPLCPCARPSQGVPPPVNQVNRYELPDNYRPLAVRLSRNAVYGQLHRTLPARSGSWGPRRPGGVIARPLPEAHRRRPALGGHPAGALLQGRKSGSLIQSSRATETSTSGLGGAKALHPTLYASWRRERPVAGFQRMLTFEFPTPAARSSEVFSASCRHDVLC